MTDAAQIAQGRISAVDAFETAMTDAAQIARGLTKAQAHWLPWFTPEPFAGRPVGMAKATLRGLIEKGLIGEDRPKLFGMVKWWITPLGQAVRAELERMQND